MPHNGRQILKNLIEKDPYPMRINPDTNFSIILLLNNFIYLNLLFYGKK